MGKSSNQALMEREKYVQWVYGITVFTIILLSYHGTIGYYLSAIGLWHIGLFVSAYLRLLYLGKPPLLSVLSIVPIIGLAMFFKLSSWRSDYEVSYPKSSISKKTYGIAVIGTFVVFMVVYFIMIIKDQFGTNYGLWLFIIVTYHFMIYEITMRRLLTISKSTLWAVLSIIPYVGLGVFIYVIVSHRSEDVKGNTPVDIYLINQEMRDKIDVTLSPLSAKTMKKLYDQKNLVSLQKKLF